MVVVHKPCYIICVLWSLTITQHTVVNSLTFELPDRKRMCFFETVEIGSPCHFDFQVTSGGNFDVDALITSPRNNTVYQVQRKRGGSFQWNADVTGAYRLCFSNQFSTITHKTVSFDLRINADSTLDGYAADDAAINYMVGQLKSIQKWLNVTVGSQKYHRRREARGRSSAESLNERVQYWSAGQSVVLVVVAVVQVVMVRRLFVDKSRAVTRPWFVVGLGI